MKTGIGCLDQYSKSLTLNFIRLANFVVPSLYLYPEVAVRYPVYQRLAVKIDSNIRSICDRSDQTKTAQKKPNKHFAPASDYLAFTNFFSV